MYECMFLMTKLFDVQRGCSVCSQDCTFCTIPVDNYSPGVWQTPLMQPLYLIYFQVNIKCCIIIITRVILLKLSRSQMLPHPQAIWSLAVGGYHDKSTLFQAKIGFVKCTNCFILQEYKKLDC